MNWNALGRAADWAGALDSLLRLSEAAIRQRNAAEAARLQALLADFREHSPPSVNELDRLAYQTGVELSRLQRETALANLKKLTEELAVQTLKIKGQADAALKRAEQIQLVAVTDAVEKARVGLTVLAGLRDDLQTADLGQQLEALLRRLQALRQAFDAEEEQEQE